MEISERHIDRFVELSLKPEWGRGKIRSVKAGKSKILFENDPEHKERTYFLQSDFLKLAANQDPSGFKGKVKDSSSGKTNKTKIKSVKPIIKIVKTKQL